MPESLPYATTSDTRVMLGQFRTNGPSHIQRRDDLAALAGIARPAAWALCGVKITRWTSTEGRAAAAGCAKCRKLFEEPTEEVKPYVVPAEPVAAAPDVLAEHDDELAHYTKIMRREAASDRVSDYIRYDLQANVARQIPLTDAALGARVRMLLAALAVAQAEQNQGGK